MATSDIISRHPDIATEVSTILKLCEKAKLQGWKEVNLKDPEFIALYVSALVASGIEPGMVTKSIGAIMSQEEFFPRPATLCRYAIPYRDRALEDRREQRLQGLKACSDKDGMPWLAQQSLIENGTYIGPIPQLGVQANTPELPDGSMPSLGMRQDIAKRFASLEKKLTGQPRRRVVRELPPIEIECIDLEGEIQIRLLKERES